MALLFFLLLPSVFPSLSLSFVHILFCYSFTLIHFFFDCMVWASLHVCLFCFVLFVSLFCHRMCECVGGWMMMLQSRVPIGGLQNASPHSPSQSSLRVTTHCQQRLHILSVFRNKLCRVGANQTASSTRATSRPCPSLFSLFSLQTRREGGEGC